MGKYTDDTYFRFWLCLNKVGRVKRRSTTADTQTVLVCVIMPVQSTNPHRDRFRCVFRLISHVDDLQHSALSYLCTLRCNRITRQHVERQTHMNTVVLCSMLWPWVRTNTDQGVVCIYIWHTCVRVCVLVGCFVMFMWMQNLWEKTFCCASNNNAAMSAQFPN